MIMIGNFKYFFFLQKKCEKYWLDFLIEFVFGKIKVFLFSENIYVYYVVWKMKVILVEVCMFCCFDDLFYSILWFFLYFVLNCSVNFNWYFK